MLNKIYINVPSNKRKIEKNETVNLTEECSAIIQNQLPPKLKDPGSFSIPCVIGSKTIENAMCNLGASVSLMPLSLCERLVIGYRNLLIVKLMTLNQHFVGGNPRV